MAAVDRRTAEGGTPLQDLMEAAGEAVAAFTLRQYPQAAHVLVLCGKGNNGGDGFVAASILAGEGVGVRVLLIGSRPAVQGEAAEAVAKLVAATSEDVIEELPAGISLEELVAVLAEADLLIDAVLGTGFKPPLREPANLLREALAQVSVPVLAVDLPSGWDADSPDEKSPHAFRADSVVTFTAPKLAHVLGHLTTSVFGPVVVADIGSPASAIHSATGLRWAGASVALAHTPRPINSNKGMYGHVLVVGGSSGTAGAPGMASLACLRAGAGLVTAAVPRSLVGLLGGTAPELMVRGLEEDAEGSAASSNLVRMPQLLNGIKVVALGPGLSTRGEASDFARAFVEQCTLPMVLDADGLNAFDASRVSALNAHSAAGSPPRTLVLTPHPGEMARLLGTSVHEVEADRINIARTFATRHSVTLVLKGWRTLIAHPDGTVAINTTGNPALAKGGSGDILTGIIAAMLAQYPGQVAHAVEAAVYLHGLAADFAAHAMHEKTVLATDVLAHLSDAFRYRFGDPDGLAWLCGLRLPSPAGPA